MATVGKKKVRGVCIFDLSSAVSRYRRTSLLGVGSSQRVSAGLGTIASPGISVILPTGYEPKIRLQQD